MMKKSVALAGLFFAVHGMSGVYAETLDIKSMFGMDVYESAEFSGSTATNAVVSHPGSVGFLLHPWRNFRPSAGETQGSVLLSVNARNDPTKGHDSRQDYERACSYFDSCENLKARVGAIYNTEEGRYWVGKDHNGVVLAAVACLNHEFSSTGKVLVAWLSVGEAQSVIRRRNRSDPFMNAFIERENECRDAIVYSGVSKRWEDPSDDFRKGCFDALIKSCSGFSTVANDCRYVRDPNGEERVTCTYLNYDGHDHRLDILFPRLGDRMRSPSFKATITDLNFGEPKIDEESARPAREKAAHRLAGMRKAAGEKRMSSGIYDGVWGYSNEFNIFVLHFDPSGVGLASISLFGCPFTWKADRKGNIVCVFSVPVDSDLRKPLEKMTVNLRYDPEKNVMYVVPPDAKSGDMPLVKLPNSKRPLHFMTKSSGIRKQYDEMMKRLDELRKRTQAVPCFSSN